MDGSGMTRACVAWLLCALLVCLTLDPPHCDLCDGPDRVGRPPQGAFQSQAHAPPDCCNSICWCCVLQGLPGPTAALKMVNTVSPHTWPKPPSNVQAARSSVFRPPRIPGRA